MKGKRQRSSTRMSLAEKYSRRIRRRQCPLLAPRLTYSVLSSFRRFGRVGSNLR
jgi:hypothetical protein